LTGDDFMDKIVERTLLYDFYGELLTEKQKQIYEYYLDDLSLGEISEQMSISRQGVHDAIKKSDKQLDRLEASLKLVNHFMKIKAIANDIYSLSNEVTEMADNVEVKTKMSQLNLLTKELVDTL